MISLLILVLLLLGPGYLTLACWRGAGRLDFWERLFLVPFISILLISWVGIVLAETGTFSLVLLGTVLGVYCLLLALIYRRTVNLGWLGRPRLDITSFLLVGIMVLAGWAFSRPAEVIAGTFDPGIYLSTGANIARYGSIAVTDPFLSQLGESLRPFLLESRGEIGVGAVRLPAFWMPNGEENTVIPAFFHLFPVWLAVLYAIGGLQAALFVSPVLGFLGVWALFLLGRRLAGNGIGLMAAGLLAVNPAQIWFARYPISEVTIQVLVLGGLTAWVLAEEQRSRLMFFFAGVSLGLAHMAKVDQLFLPVVVALGILLAWLFGRRDDVGRTPARLYLNVLVPYGLLAIHSAVHVYLFSFAYTWINLGPFISTVRSIPAVAAYAVIALALTAAILFRNELSTAGDWITERRKLLSIGLAFAVGGVALYGYFWWPLSPDRASSVFLSSDGVTPIYLNLFREEGLVRLGWYLSPLGLILGLAGFVRFVGRGLNHKVWPLLTLFAGQTTLYLFTAGLAYPVHFWSIRRYVPLVIPVFLLLAAVALSELRFKNWHRANRPPARFLAPLSVILPALLFVALLGASVQRDVHFLWQTEYRGAMDGLGRWARQIEDPAVVLFKPRIEGNVFASPLQNFFGKTVFILQKEMEEPFYSEGVRKWLADGKNVYLVLSDRYPKHLSGDIRYDLVDSRGLELESMEQASDHFPEETVPLIFPLRLYRLEPVAGYPYRLDMGPLRVDEAVQLQLRRPASPFLHLKVRAWAAGRGPQPLFVYLNDQPVQSLLVGQQSGVYEADLPIPASQYQSTVQISLRTSLASGSDTEAIVLEWVEVAEASRV